MINRRKYTDTELNKILSKKNIVILVDSREKANKHILDVFDREGIQYRVTALESGDYTFELKAIPELDIDHTMDFRQDVMIERKNSLDEISGNFTRGRERFNDEFGRAWAVKKYLLIEDGSYEKILNHEYMADHSATSFFGSLLSFDARYDLHVCFANKETSAILIYNICKYALREILK